MTSEASISHAPCIWFEAESHLREPKQAEPFLPTSTGLFHGVSCISSRTQKNHTASFIKRVCDSRPSLLMFRSPPLDRQVAHISGIFLFIYLFMPFWYCGKGNIKQYFATALIFRLAWVDKKKMSSPLRGNMKVSTKRMNCVFVVLKKEHSSTRVF